MSATTSGAIKAHLESKGRGIAWYRDRAPQDAALPYGVVQEGIGQSPVAMGDTQDPDGEKVVIELVQVTLFEVWRDSDGRPAENFPLPDLIWKDLHGARLATHPKQVGGMVVRSRIRIPAVDSRGAAYDTADQANVVSNVFTVAITRSV